MQKLCEMIKANKQLATGVFLAGVVATAGVTSVYSKIKTFQAEQEAVETYGKLGYGRGDGSSTGDRQGYGRDGKSGQGGQGGQGQGQGGNQGLNKDNCLMDGCLLVDDADYPVGELDAETIGYLEAAIADERKALATYEAVMDQFGDVKPFINIARAEEQHISILKALFDKYGVEVPADTTTVGALPVTLGEVCAVGVQAEIDNDQLYQDMIGEIEQEDIKSVFIALANASIEMHLPAFERCAN